MKTPILGLTLFSLLATPLAAAAPSYVSEAPIAYMTDLSSGAVLFSRDADKQIPPASMAKMMTVYVAFDLIKKGELKLDQTLPVSAETWKKWNNQGSSMFLAVGSKVTVADLLDGIVTLSGNDACVVLAEGIAGSEEAFVDMMNKKAKEIGLANSRFGNSNGWPDEGVTQVTARDLALTLPRTADTDKVSLKVVYQGPLKAPIAKGQQVASLIVSAPDMQRQVMPLVAGEAVEEAGFFGRIWAGILSFFGA